jgi:hypothetical protein
MEKLDYLEIAITAAIFIISATVFFKSFRKISQFIKNTIFHDPLI